MVTVKGPAGCEECGSSNVDFKFDRPFNEFAHMTLAGELIFLERLPVTLSCKDCTWSWATWGYETTIDIAKGIVLFCRIPRDGDPACSS